MKKALSIILLLSMLAGVILFAGCGAVETTPAPTTGAPTGTGTTAPTTTEPAEIVPINVIWWSNGGIVTEEGMAKVNEALNEITIPLINVEVNLQIWNVGTYVGTAATVIANREDVDLMITFPAAAAHFNPMTAQGMLLPLDDLLATYAPETLELIPEEWWAATTRNDQIFGVPVFHNRAGNLYYVYDADMADAVGFAEDDVRTLEDIHELLRAVKAKFPNVIPLTGDNRTLDFTYPGIDLISGLNYDTAGETTAVAAGIWIRSDGTSDYQVFSRYESEGFITMTNMLRTWYTEGLIDRDAPTHRGKGKNLDGTVFSFTEFGSYSTLTSRISNYKNEARYVQLSEGELRTGALMQMTTAIPVSSDEPEAAAKFLNLMYTNADVVNLVNFGVEGEHYTVAANGQFQFPEGVTRQTTEFFPNAFNFVGNVFLNNTWVGQDPQINQIELEILDKVKVSPILGFSFNTAPVSAIHTQLSTIANDEFGPALFTGAAPAGHYEEFIAKMKAAGLAEYMAELQRQLDAWLAAR